MDLNVRDDAIAFAEMLIGKYTRLSGLDSRIIYCESATGRMQSEMHLQRHSAMRFIWPFIVTAIVLFFGITGILTMQSFLMGARGDAMGEPLNSLAMPIGLAAGLAVLVPGIIFGIKRAEKRNMSIARRETEMREEVLKLLRELTDLKAKKDVLLMELEQYNRIVPKGLRAKTQMERIKALLVSGKANTFEEAVKICSQE